MRRYIVALFIICLFVSTFSIPAFAQKTDTIKVGVFLPMTGGVAAYGQEEWEGIQVAQPDAAHCPREKSGAFPGR
jgi:branched-chain amino acid transport system substrate-binding protein